MNAASRILERNWALLALGKKEDARKGIDRVLAAGKVPEALLQDATMKLDQKDYAGARKSIEEALGKTPEDVRALFVLVQSYEAQKQTAEAVQIMREYALKQPKSAAVQQYLGQTLFAARRPRRSAQSLRGGKGRETRFCGRGFFSGGTRRRRRQARRCPEDAHGSGSFSPRQHSRPSAAGAIRNESMGRSRRRSSSTARWWRWTART